MTISESTAIESAYKKMYEFRPSLNESSPEHGSEADRFLFGIVKNEDIVPSYRNPSDIIITSNVIDDSEKRAKLDEICKTYGFTYELSEYDDYEDGYHLNPSEPFKNELERYSNRVDDFEGIGEFGNIRKNIRGISEFATALSKTANGISEAADDLDSMINFDDMKQIGELSFTLGAKMDYLYSYERKLENLIKSLEKYRKYALEKNS